MHVASRAAAILTVAVFVACRPAHARLGENEAYCDQRYNETGKPVPQTPADKWSPLEAGASLFTRTYSYKGWTVRIGFTNSVAICIRYMKDPVGPEIGAQDIAAILAPNTDRFKWQKIASPNDPMLTTNATVAAYHHFIDNLPFWIRTDGAVAYKRRFERDRFTLMNREAIGMAVRKQREDEARKAPPPPMF